MKLGKRGEILRNDSVCRFPIVTIVILLLALFASLPAQAGDDEDKTAKLLKKAERGDAQAQVELGWLYESGKGVKTDLKEAVKWYRKSAEQGVADGQSNLGWMYESGRGVEKEYAEAVKWYRKAADQGQARGQCNLGVMYEYGRGVDKDVTEAVRWYRKAAEQGYARGQAYLGSMYQTGEGVPKGCERGAEVVPQIRRAGVRVGTSPARLVVSSGHRSPRGP